MPVTDTQVATLRAHLAGEHEKYQELWSQLDKNDARRGYAALVAAACFEAVDLKFADDGAQTDVITYVSDVRARFDDTGDQIDPVAAERVIQFMLGTGSIDDLDDTTRFTTQITLLTALVMDLNLSSGRLEQLITEARQLADEWMAGPK